MNVFYAAQESQIENWSENLSKHGPLALIGEQGCGKFTTAQQGVSCLVHTTKLYKGDFFQFQDLCFEIGDESDEARSFAEGTWKFQSYIAQVFKRISSILHRGEIVYFDNMECCDAEHFRILSHVVRYCSANGVECRLILSFNSPSECIDSWKAKVGHEGINPEHWVCFERLEEDDIEAYVYSRLDDSSDEQTKRTFAGGVSHASEGILGIATMIIHTLDKMRVISSSSLPSIKIKPGFTARDLPNNLTDLYALQLSHMDQVEKDALKYVLPFGSNVNIGIIKELPEPPCSQHDSVEDVYASVHRKSSFLEKSRVYGEPVLFDKTYRLGIDSARKAMEKEIGKERRKSLDQSVRNVLYTRWGPKNESAFQKLPLADRYELLSFLGGFSPNGDSRIHCSVVTTLMTILMSDGFFARTCEIAEEYLEKRGHRYESIAEDHPMFFEYYLWGLYLQGDYSSVIEEYQKLGNKHIPRCTLLCARAYYARDDLNEAKALAHSVEKEPSVASEAHLLLSSIYDWNDDTKKSRVEFIRAVKAAAKTKKDNSLEPAKQQQAAYASLLLRKNYLFFDAHRMPEFTAEVDSYCQSVLNGANVEPLFAKLYAEILHNRGTELIKNKSTREQGREYLSASDEYLRHACEEDRYCPRNSLAIADCLDGNYEQALSVFECLYPPAHSPFCVMAIRNNEWVSQMHSSSLDHKNNPREMIDDLLYKLARENGVIISTQSGEGFVELGGCRRDIKRQLKHYCINRAAEENDWELKLHWLALADSVSDAESSSNYLVKRKLYELSERLDHAAREGFRKKHGIKKGIKHVSVSSIDYHFYEANEFLCEVMFWG